MRSYSFVTATQQLSVDFLMQSQHPWQPLGLILKWRFREPWTNILQFSMASLFFTELSKPRETVHVKLEKTWESTGPH